MRYFAASEFVLLVDLQKVNASGVSTRLHADVSQKSMARCVDNANSKLQFRLLGCVYLGCGLTRPCADPGVGYMTSCGTGVPATTAFQFCQCGPQHEVPEIPFPGTSPKALATMLKICLWLFPSVRTARRRCPDLPHNFLGNSLVNWCLESFAVNARHILLRNNAPSLFQRLQRVGCGKDEHLMWRLGQGPLESKRCS